MKGLLLGESPVCFSLDRNQYCIDRKSLSPQNLRSRESIPINIQKKKSYSRQRCQGVLNGVGDEMENTRAFHTLITEKLIKQTYATPVFSRQINLIALYSDLSFFWRGLRFVTLNTERSVSHQPNGKVCSKLCSTSDFIGLVRNDISTKLGGLLFPSLYF